MYGTLFVAPLMTWCMRQAVVDDQLEANTLHLMRLCPQAWVSKVEETVFENMPTEYGPVSLRWKLSADGRTLDVKLHAKWRNAPGRIVLHKPAVAGVEQIVVNGKPQPASDFEIQAEEIAAGANGD